MAVWRTGSKARPASWPNFSGTSGGRNVVVPMSSMDLPVVRDDDADGVEVGVAALARAEAFGRVALDELNVVVAVLHRVDDVLGLQVLVEVDEVLAALRGEDRIGVGDRTGERVFGRREARHAACPAPSPPQPGRR